MKRIYVFAVIIALLPSLLQAQKTFIPDNNFEQYLVNIGYDNVMDNYVETSNIAGMKQLSLERRNIASLTGIQDFESLEKLFCYNNLLTELNLTGNKKLYSVICDSNQLTSLIVGGNPALVTISCQYNQLTSIDVSNCKSLENLGCDYNQITSLDVSANPAIQSIYCQENHLASINVNAGSLRELFLRTNRLTSIDLSSNSNLEKLDVKNNQLTSLDLSNNRKLKWLMGNDNQLTSLNVSGNPAIYLLYCRNNQLTSLNLKNGNNHNLNGGLPGVIGMYATNNPNLSCIQVDDPVAARGYLWRKDAFAIYSADCKYVDPAARMTYIPDDHFEQALIDQGFDTGLLNDSVPTKALDTLSTLDVSGKEIEDLTGINDFTSLEELDCSQNKLTTIQAEQVLPLTFLYCFDNQISDLNLGVNSSLTVLNCSFNQLPSFQVNSYTPLKRSADNSSQSTGLIINANATLKEFYCQGNQFTTLDVGAITTLEKLDCNNNRLTALNLKNGSNSALSVMDATNNSDLSCIQVDDPLAAESFTGWSKDLVASYAADCGYTGIIKSMFPIEDDGLVIYPNPSSVQIRIKNTNSREFEGVLEIFDITGKKCFEKQIPPGNEEIRVDISWLDSGLYFCKIRFGDTCLTGKIIVDR